MKVERNLLVELVQGAKENLNVALKWGSNQLRKEEIEKTKQAISTLTSILITLKRVEKK